MKQRVLISGGGIAGTAAAFWLTRAGHEVTIVERAHAFAPLGHYLTLKSQGVQTVASMGLLDACRERELSFRDLTAHALDGRLLRRVDPRMLARKVQGMVLFRRADLHAALFDAVRDQTDLRFGTEVQAIRQVGEQLEVDIADRTERFDLVLGADGVHSRARKLLFGEAGVTRMGGRYVAVTADYPHGLTPGVVSTYLGRGQFVALLPRTAANVSALIYHGDGGELPAGNDARSVRAFLCHAYAGFAPEVRRTFEVLDDRSFVFIDDITMITLPAITRGRVALLGDAAHCPTFMSGMGASLALQGAQALSRALSEHGADVEAGVASYERAIQPIAHSYQRNAKTARLFLLDRSPQLATMRDAVLRWTPDFLLGMSAQRFYRANQLA